VPRWIYKAIILVNLLMLIPPVLIARSRTSRSRDARIHLFHDMDNQRRYEAQSPNPLFADGRAMRPPVPGTIARGELAADDHFHRGRRGDDWAATFPAQVTVDDALLVRGRERFGIYCTPCHGISGHGDGMVARRSNKLLQTWVIGDLAAQKARDYPVGQIFNIITNGTLTMPPYRSQIPEQDRWAIVAWVRALQYSQAAEFASLPEERQAELRAVKPPPAPAGGAAPSGGTPPKPGAAPTKPSGGR
jgi:mono/diheme cytochrome c family protein